MRDDKLWWEAIENILLLTQKQLGEGASLLDAARAAHRRNAADYREKWETTKNPVWVWRCLTRLNSFCVGASAFCPELRGHDFVDGMPDWCQAYLLETAYRIESLAGLRDFRTPGALEQANGKPVSVKQATSLTAAALGITRAGWNAIKEYQAEDYPRLWLDARDIESADGRRPTFSLQHLADAMGWENERTARRKVSALRKRGGGVKPRTKV